MEEGFSIGINLGAVYLTSAYITGSNEFVQVASIEASSEWKASYRSLLRERNERPDDTREDTLQRIIDTGFIDLVTSTLLAIGAATTDKMGRAVDLKTISYPQQFGPRPYLSTLATALIANPSFPEITNTLQFQSYLECTRRAYNLYAVEPLGYAPGTNLADENTLIMQVQYERDFLEVSFVEVDSFVNSRNRYFRIIDFGREELERSTVYGWSIPRMRIGSKVVYEQPPGMDLLKMLLENLLSDQFAPDVPYIEGTRPDMPEDVRAVVFSGSAPGKNFEEVKKAILQVQPMFEKRFKDDIEPLWVAARGAAVWSRDFDLMPPYGGRTFGSEVTYLD